MNIDYFINVLFEATSIKLSEYEEIHKKVLFNERGNLSTDC